MRERDHIEIISIGDELLTGQISNTNAAWMAEHLLRNGIKIDQITTIGDNKCSIFGAFKDAESRCKVVLVTGGLGPTHDDITRAVVSEYFNSPLKINSDVLRNMQDFFRHRGITMASINEDQAKVPEIARLMVNDRGTAPGYVIKGIHAIFYIMPGVPHEMKAMVERYVLPELKSQINTTVIQAHYLCTIGIAESTLFEKIGNIHEIEKYARVAFLPGFSGVKIRVSTEYETETKAGAMLKKAVQQIRRNIKMHIYAEEDIALEHALAILLTKKKKTIATAESCTGGLIANKFTNIPGSSKYFERGIVSYSNRSKTELLGVPKEMIEAHGAVSEQVAVAMAVGVRKLAASDYSLATTGIAGPDGGTVEKPTGLVYVAFASAKRIDVQRHVFIGERSSNKERFAYAALNLLRRNLPANNDT